MKKGNGLTLLYALVQAGFWVGLCVYLMFSSVYLLGIGYSNAQFGAIIAAGNVLSALLATGLSTMIDRYEWCSARRATVPVLAAELIVVVLIAAFPSVSILTSVCFVLYIALGLCVNTLNLKLYIDAEKKGAVIDYGISRSAGSMAVVLASFLLGFLVKSTSVRAVPVTGVIVCILQFVFFGMMMRRVPDGESAGDTAAREEITLVNFVRNNKRYCVLLAGTILLFFAHNSVCNFMVNVTGNVGVDAAGMGILNGFMAFVEVPVMVFYSRFSRGRDTGRLLRFSFVCFLLKGIAIASAHSFALLFAALALQAPSYALYSAAIVPYVEENIRYEDSAKAQSLAFTMTNIGSILAGLISGPLYDRISVTSMLWIAGAAGAAGALVAIAGTRTAKTADINRSDGK